MSTDIQRRIEAAQGYAQRVALQGDLALRDAAIQLKSIDPRMDPPPQADLPAKPDISDVGKFPVFEPINPSFPDAPDKPDKPEKPEKVDPQDLPEFNAEAPTFIEDAPKFIGGDVPQFKGTAPTFNENTPIFKGTVPTFKDVNPPTAMPVFSDQPPVINTLFVFPDPPELLKNPKFGEPPKVGDHKIPDRPNITPPTFEGVAPTDTTQAPTNLEGQLRSAYQGASSSMLSMMDGYVDSMLHKNNPQFHGQMARIESQLKKYLDGGTGLNAAAENAIYERARGKNDAEARRTQAAAYADTANRGFTMPNGALMAAIGNARQASADNNARAASEIVAMQAEMEQKNLQFAVTTSAGLRQAMLSAALSYHGNCITINGQALTFAQSVLGAIVEIYNTAVKIFTLKLDAYKAEASVFDTRMRVVTMGIEIYKAEIQAVEALHSVDKVKMDVYRARIDSLSSLATMYRSQVDAVVSKAGLEKLKLELFSAQVQIYETRVRANESDYKRMAADVQIQELDMKKYATQAEVFNIELSGHKAKADVFSTEMQAYKAEADVFSTEMQGYKTKADVFSTEVQTHKAKADVFSTEMQAHRTEADVFSIKMQGQKTAMEIKNAEVERSFKYDQITSDQYARSVQVYSEVVRANGQIASTRIENQKQSILAYQVQSQASFSKAQAFAEHYKAVSSVQISNARLKLEGIVQEATNKREYGKNIAELGTATAGVYQGLASAAISGLNTLVGEMKYD